VSWNASEEVMAMWLGCGMFEGVSDNLKRERNKRLTTSY
jgi:hypothetical protein